MRIANLQELGSAIEEMELKLEEKEA